MEADTINLYLVLTPFIDRRKDTDRPAAYAALEAEVVN